MFADIQAAIDVEKRMLRSKSTTKDLLNKVAAEYNKMTTVKNHRIDGPRKKLLFNLYLDKFVWLSKGWDIFFPDWGSFGQTVTNTVRKS